MRAYEKEILTITDFEQAAQDPSIQKRLAEDAEFRQRFESQRKVQSLMSVMAGAQVSSDIQTRVKSGALRQIRSIDPETTPSSAWAMVWEWKWVWGAALLLLLVVPAVFNQGNALTPVTDFTYESTPALPLAEVTAEAPPMQIASNTLQNAPIQATPVRYDIP